MAQLQGQLQDVGALVALHTETAASVATDGLAGLDGLQRTYASETHQVCGCCCASLLNFGQPTIRSHLSCTGFPLSWRLPSIRMLADAAGNCISFCAGTGMCADYCKVAVSSAALNPPPAMQAAEAAAAAAAESFAALTGSLQIQRQQLEAHAAAQQAASNALLARAAGAVAVARQRLQAADDVAAECRDSVESTVQAQQQQLAAFEESFAAGMQREQVRLHSVMALGLNLSD